MNPLYEKEFKKNMNEIEDAEIIPVQPGSNTLSGSDNHPPLSRFKQQRLKEKEKKMRKKMKQSQEEIKKNSADRKLASDARKEKHNIKSVTHGNWNQARSLVSTIHNTIDNYNNVAIQAISLPTIAGVEIAQEGIDILTSKSNIVFRDVAEFNNKLASIISPYHAKQGKVDENDLPDFFAVYEELLNLNQDIINVLTDPCIELSDMIKLVERKITEAREEKKDE